MPPIIEPRNWANKRGNRSIAGLRDSNPAAGENFYYGLSHNCILRVEMLES